MSNKNEVFTKTKYYTVENNTSSIVENMSLDENTIKSFSSASVVAQVNKNTTMNNDILSMNNSTDNILDSNITADPDPNYATITIIAWIVALLMCYCAKPNVPDASYRRYPNGVPVVKKKKEIDPEDRKKLIESKMITKEVTGQTESGEVILNGQQNIKDTMNYDDGTRIVVETYSNEENNLYDDDDDNDDFSHGSQEESRVTTDGINNSLTNSPTPFSWDIGGSDEDGIVCMICLEPFEKGELVSWSKEMKCRHIFHKDCIHPWLMNHEDCPTCRNLFLPENFEDSPDPQPSSQPDQEEAEDEEDYNGPYIIDFNGLIFRASEKKRRSFVESVRRLSLVSSNDGKSISSSSNSSTKNDPPQKPPPEFIDIENQQNYASLPSSEDTSSSMKNKSYSLASGKMPSDIFRKGKELFQNNIFMKQWNGKRRLNNQRYSHIIQNSSSGESSSSSSTPPSQQTIDEEVNNHHSITETTTDLSSANSRTALNQSFPIALSATTTATETTILPSSHSIL